MPGIVTYDGKGNQVSSVVFPEPSPVNPGNPYFGKKPKRVGDFWGHVMAVYVAVANGADASEKQANGLDRFARLRQSRRTIGLADVIQGNDLIDPDDVGGDFLKMLGLLTTTKHETDDQLLMTTTERDAIMLAWA